MTSPNIPTPGSSPESPKPAPRKRNWKKILLISGGGVVVGGVFLVLLAPTLLSTGAAKSIILGQVNSRLNGKVEIDSWSFGWWSPLSLEGIKVYDDQNRLALTVKSVTTGVTILHAASGNYNIGDVVIDSPNLVLVEMNADGTNNFAKMLKGSAAESKPAAEAKPVADAKPAAPSAPSAPAAPPSKLPEVTGTITIKNLQGAISGTAVGPAPIRIENSDIALKIPSLQNQPISDDVKLTIRRDGSQPGTITVAGNLQAITAGIVDVEKLKANQKVSISGLDLSSANAFLAPAGVKLTVGGTVDGTLDAKVDGLDSATVNGEIKVAKLSAGGEQLKGDTFATELLTIPIAVATTKDADGSPHISVQSLGAHAAEFAADVKVDVSQKTLENLGKQLPPGGTGSVDVSLSLPDASKMTAQLPHLLALGKDVTIKSGAANVSAHVGIEPAAANVVATVKVDNVAGTNAGKAVSLDPINVDLDASAAFAKPGEVAVTFRKAALASSFATAHLSGSQNDVSFDVDVSLDKAKAQAIQFKDLGPMDFGGQLKASGSVKGDVLAHGPLLATAHVEQSDLRVAGVGTLGTINVDRLVADLSSTVQMGAENAVSAKDSKIKLEVGSAAAPVVKADVTVANVDVKSRSVSKFDVAVDVTNLKEVQQRFGGLLVKAIGANDLTFQGGSIHVAAAGDVKNAKPALSQPAVVELKGVTLYNGQAALLKNENLSIKAEASSPDDFKTINANLDVTSSLFAASVQGAALDLSNPDDIWNMATARRIVVQVSDLGRLQALANAASPRGIMPIYQDRPIADSALTSWTIQKGSFDADLSVSRKGTVTSVDVSVLKLRNFTMASDHGGSQSLKNDVDLKVSLAVDAALANGKTTVQQIKSATITALDGSLGVATIKVDEPIVLSNLAADSPSANGAITVSGDVQDITSFLMVPGYSGTFTVKQKLSSGPEMTSASGTVEANLQLKDAAGKVVFSDPKILVSNDVTINSKSMDLVIKTLSVTTSAGAADVSVTGAVKDLNKTRTISDPVKVTLKYDLAKIVPLATPFLSASTQQMLAGSAISGQFSKVFTVSGSYPAGVASDVAIKSLAATGGFAIAVADVPSQGAHLGNFDVAFKLDKGIATVQMAKPADLNGGTLNLNSAAVNLSEPVPHLDMADGTILVQGIALNKVLSDKMGTFFGPIFVNTDKASGLVTVKFDKCVHVPLSDLAMQNVAANDGMAQVSLDIANLELVGGFAGDFLRQIPGIGSLFVGNVKGAKFTIQHGIVDHDLPIIIGTGNDPSMRFTGKIELFGDQRLNPMQVRIGSALLKDKIPFVKDIVQVADPVFVIKGTLSHPQLDLAAGIGQWIKDQGKGLLPGLLGGGVPGSKASTQPADKKDNLGDDILKGLGSLGKKKKK